MSWREQLRAASFRGVSFNYRGGDLGGGRRVVNHVYPMREENYAEDMGRKARTISLTAVIAGDDYMARRDQLLAALEAVGPGALVHPYHGTVEVLCESFSCREETGRGGVAEITISFVPFGANRYPQAATSGSTTTTTAVSTQGTALDVFTRLYGVAGQPGWAVDEAVGEVHSALDFLGRVVAVTGVDVQAVGAFLALVEEVVGAIEEIINDPAAVAQAMANAVIQGVVTGGVDTALEIVGGGEPPWGLTLTSYAATTATRQTQQVNQRALLCLMRSTAVAEAVKLAVGNDYDSYDAAAGVRDGLIGAIDAVRAQAGDDGLDDIYLAMGGLKAETVSAFRDIAKLPYLRTVEAPPAVKPTLVLAYELYGDIERAQEIQRRNPAVSHPGFLPQGAGLEVLSA